MRIASAVILTSLLAGCASVGVDPAASVPRSPYPLSAAATKVIQDGVRKSLKDPNSAMFGTMVAAKGAGDAGVYVCGYVNAKNSFGGYTGDTPFMGLLAVDDKKGPFAFGLTGMGGTDTETAVIYQMCREYGVPV